MQVMLRVNNLFGVFVGTVTKIQISNLVAARSSNAQGLKCSVENGFLEIEGERFELFIYQHSVDRKDWDLVDMRPSSVVVLLALLSQARWEILPLHKAISAGWINFTKY